MDILVGSYSEELAGMPGNGEGIYRVSFDPETGAFSDLKLLYSCVNPSSLVWAREERHLFAGREVFAEHQPAVLSLEMTPDGQIVPLSCLALPGELPCKIAYDPHHRRLASAQYWSGDVAIVSLEDGVFDANPVYTKQMGHGPNLSRQEGPHAHYVAFTDQGDVLHIVDLGTDAVVSHRLGSDNAIEETSCLKLPAGCGPRHMAITKDERRAFVFCELDESLVTLARDGLGWRVISQQPGFAMEDGVDGSGAAIRLSPDERHLYVSSRRLSAIACFKVDGEPELLGEIESGGISPREFIVTSDGNWLIVANQNSNSLTSLRRDRDTGLLSPSHQTITIGSPVALVEM
ncbi:lactonase family protein [uncultured Cohaesibacter sp.]|uniref:lactonase family protein n=1 Tax=uncultured Cohaesibacter sp. TaxID=1002546 RepID=UPI0029C7B136|nr:lactonase family protein [uncultured Cohaesibacter sp.]